MIKKKIIPVISLISIFLILLGIAIYLQNRNSSAATTFFAMDTIMSVKAEGPDAPKAVSRVEQTILELENELSVSNDQSIVYALNRDKHGSLTADTKYLFEKSLQVKEMTGGAFDICIYPIMDAWGFTDKNFRVPNEDTLKQLCLELSEATINVDNEHNSVSLSDTAMVDFGGIAKGYTSKVAYDIFKEMNISNALINLGGNVCALGKKSDGSLWSVAIKSPLENLDYLGILKISDKSVITSGGYERFFEQGNRTYHHIIDPKTGYPAESGLISVTIVSDDPTLADALSTAVYVMGKEEATALWNENFKKFDMILYDDNNRLYITEGLKDDFTSELEYEIIEK